MGKYLMYTVTLLAYTTIHIMRMSLPFVQLDLMKFFNIHRFQMGIANACLYIVIGISYLYRALKPIQRPQFTYFWTIILCSSFYLIIPILVFANIRVPALYFVSLAGFGWFQTSSWPVLLALVHTEFLPKRDGCMLGFWSASGDIGNILGFLMSTVVVFGFKFPFQVCLVVAGLTGILMAIAVYRLDVNLSHEHIQPDTQGYTSRICAQFKIIMRDHLVMFMILMLCMLKAILYGLLLWLPMYFQQQGFKQFEGIIPISMNVAAIIGSIVLGFVFQKVASQAIRATVFMSTLILTVITFFIIKQVQFTVQNQLVLLLLICIIGFCVMGNFNIISAHEVATAADRLGFQIAALSSWVMSMGNIFVGIIQFVIGKMATQDSQSIFLIFFVMSIVLIVIQIFRTIYLWRLKLSAQHQKIDQVDTSRQRNQAIQERPQEEQSEL